LRDGVHDLGSILTSGIGVLGSARLESWGGGMGLKALAVGASADLPELAAVVND
jgi:hypothetical protein